MIKCICCGKEIDSEWDNPKTFKLYDYDGDFIHIACIKDQEMEENKINNMTDEEFEIYMSL